MKRTWVGIQFTYNPDLYGGVWVSEDDIQLHCASGLRRPLSDHWSVWYHGRSMCSGMTATEALETFLKMEKRVV